MSTPSSTQRSDMSHELRPATVDQEGTLSIECSCGAWHRVFHSSAHPRMQEIQAEHQDHRFRAGAEELRAGTEPPRVTLEGVLRKMSDFARASMEAAVTMESFLQAHKEAQQSGVGVVVARSKEGRLVPVPSIFVPRGSVVFMEAPSAVPFQKEFDFPQETRYSVSIPASPDLVELLAPEGEAA